MTGHCDGGCGGMATRELLDPMTRTPLGVFVCDFGAREYGIRNSRAIPSTAAPASIPDAAVGAQPNPGQSSSRWRTVRAGRSTASIARG